MEAQPSNALSPMDTTSSPISAWVSSTHDPKAWLPIEVTPFSIVQNHHWIQTGPYIRQKAISAGVVWSRNPLDYNVKIAEGQLLYEGTGPEENIVIPEEISTEDSVTSEEITVNATETTEETIEEKPATVSLKKEIAEEAETSEEADEETDPSEETMMEEAVIELKDGDVVTVYYNGASTRSIPPQLTALEIMIHR